MKIIYDYFLDNLGSFKNYYKLKIIKELFIAVASYLICFDFCLYIVMNIKNNNYGEGAIELILFLLEYMILVISTFALASANLYFGITTIEIAKYKKENKLKRCSGLISNVEKDEKTVKTFEVGNVTFKDFDINTEYITYDELLQAFTKQEFVYISYYNDILGQNIITEIKTALN